MNNFAATLFAYGIGIAIPLFAIYVMYTFDLFGTGKSSSLLICLVWGGVAVLVALQVNNLALSLTNYEVTVRFLAPVIEEIIKSAMLFFLITRPRFRYIVDGAVYGFASGIGFAVIENILYIRNNPGAALGLAVARSLSTSLMHATTSALIGIALGHLRRSTSGQKIFWALGGFVPAMLIHIGYNIIVNLPGLNGTILLIVAIGIGITGFALITYQIRRGVAEEKQRFGQTLGISVGVTTAERKAVQELGGNAIENILKELGDYFGNETAEQIRRLLVLQANIGILTNNLDSQVSERLRKAWRAEIAEKRAEMDQIRNGLGVYVMSFVRGVFPDEDSTVNDALKREYSQFDPTQVHSFDMFITAGRVTNTLSIDKISETADLLNQVEIFRQVPVVELENLSRAITSRHFNDGDLIFEQGDEGDTMFVVEEGQIGIYIRDGGGERQISICQPGDLVGELALLDGSPRSARARALGSVRALVLRREHFLMFVRSRPNVILSLLEYLSRRARRLSDIVEKSVEWASLITQGEERAANEIAGQLQAVGFNIPAPRAALRSSIAHTGTDEPEPGTTGRPVAMGGLFASMSSALEERDAQSIKKSTQGTRAAQSHEPADRRSMRMSGLFAHIKTGDAHDFDTSAAPDPQSDKPDPTLNPRKTS